MALRTVRVHQGDLDVEYLGVGRVLPLADGGVRLEQCALSGVPWPYRTVVISPGASFDIVKGGVYESAGDR
jgi:hypothetical protein